MNNEISPTLFDDSQLPQEQSEQVIFDYRLLSADKREFVLQKTDETQWLLKKTAENIIKIGRNLLDVKTQLPHGMFGLWLQSEFGMSQKTSSNFMRVAETFETKLVNFTNLSVSALYLLASDNAPQSAVDEALELADKGKKVTHAMAQKLIEAEKAKEKAELEKAQALAEAEIAQQKLFAVKTETETKITELSEQITALQEEMTTLTTPATEYVDKEVWPEDKAKELEDLQVKLNELNTNLEAEKKAIPEATQKELDSFKKQLDSLKAEKQQQELLNKSQQERLQTLDSQLKVAIKDRITSENDERIRQEWRSINSEARSCLMRLLGSWPTSLDIQSFESDDWERLSQLKSTLKRVLEECDNLNYNGDDMIVDDTVVQEPLAYIEGSTSTTPGIGIPPKYKDLFEEYKRLVLSFPENDFLWSAQDQGYTNQMMTPEKHIQFTKELLSSEVDRRVRAAEEAMKRALGTWQGESNVTPHQASILQWDSVSS